MPSCNICRGELQRPVYQSENDSSLSSLCKLVPGKLNVYSCKLCGHVYTPPSEDLARYYADDYSILIESDEEDQIVSSPNGRKEFRFDLQVRNLINKVPINKNTRLLDYGCAKSTTTKMLGEKIPGFSPYLFDVSEMYIPFWKKFIPEDRWSVHAPKDNWHDSFDVVTSFFSLEHVEEPNVMLKTVKDLLKSDGIFYCVIPDVLSNTADFIVSDHVNHFTKPSITRLLSNNGFSLIEIDDKSHFGALTITARKNESGTVSTSDYLPGDVLTKIDEIADYWNMLRKSICDFETTYDKFERIAVYGSGFYGSYITVTMRRPEQIACYVDQNPHRHSQTLFDRPIVPPECIPSDIRYIHVGLNPLIAREAIDSIHEWKDRDFTYNFL